MKPNLFEKSMLLVLIGLVILMFIEMKGMLVEYPDKEGNPQKGCLNYQDQCDTNIINKVYVIKLVDDELNPLKIDGKDRATLKKIAEFKIIKYIE